MSVGATCREEKVKTVIRPIPVPIENCLEKEAPPRPDPFPSFTYCLKKEGEEDFDKTRCFAPEEFHRLLEFLEDLTFWARNAEIQCGVREDVESQDP